MSKNVLRYKSADSAVFSAAKVRRRYVQTISSRTSDLLLQYAEGQRTHRGLVVDSPVIQRGLFYRLTQCSAELLSDLSVEESFEAIDPAAEV